MTGRIGCRFSVIRYSGRGNATWIGSSGPTPSQHPDKEEDEKDDEQGSRAYDHHVLLDDVEDSEDDQQNHQDDQQPDQPSAEVHIQWIDFHLHPPVSQTHVS
jgi:hypothetical protein